MPRYFFDFRDGETVPDLDGTELDSVDAARYEAALALAEFARDVLPGSHHRELMIEVHEEAGPILFTASLVFAMIESSELASPSPRGIVRT